MTGATWDAAKYWDAFTPYENYLENVIGINSDNLEPIIPLIKSPVLVVGAGQGLLVGELRKMGFAAEGIDISPQMVAGAERRRGIKLFLGNANNMPFENAQFKTSIIATGVLDFMDDRAQIGAIMNETRRVTDAQGEIFIALLGLTPQTEELVKYIGILSDNRLSLKMGRQILFGPQGLRKEIIAVIRKDPNKSVPGLAFRAVKSFISAPRRARARIKSVKALLAKAKKREIAHPKILFDYGPEYGFIRTERQINELFTALNSPPRKIFKFDNCKIVRL